MVSKSSGLRPLNHVFWRPKPLWGGEGDRPAAEINHVSAGRSPGAILATKFFKPQRAARADFHPRLRSTLILRLISAGHPPAPSLSVAGRALQNTRPRNRVENPMPPPFDMASHSNKWVLRFELPTSHYRTAQRPQPLLECVQTSNDTILLY